MTIKQIRTALGWNKKKAYTYLGCSFLTYDKYEDDESLQTTKRYLSYQKKLLEALSLEKESALRIDTTTDDFAFIRNRNAYYVDKSLLIKEILDSGESTLLFARPRRFGKSLNLSMVRHFFDLNSSPDLFDGLAIASYPTFCKKYQNQYPVIFVSFKDVEGLTFEDFLLRLNHAIASGLAPLMSLLKSHDLSTADHAFLERLYNRAASKEDLRCSLFRLTELLEAAKKQKVVVLIDEYDVPLQKASLQDYYDQALDIVSGLFSMVLKTNEHLFLGVVTGCLKISKESIFTGLNNVSAYTLFDNRYKNDFGFTEKEVDKMLEDFGLSDKKREVQRYYDGYPGQGTHIYCPFDVVRYVSDHLANHEALPLYYWMNSSENEIIRALLNVSSPLIRDEVDALVRGASITKEINLSLTYRDLYKNPSHIYSVLLYAGYLIMEEYDGKQAKLSIPNEEVNAIFSSQIMEWMEEKMEESPLGNDLVESLFRHDFDKASTLVSDFLWDTVGVHDYARQKRQREAFYHGVLLGLLSSAKKSRVYIKSNPEAGTGFLDIALVQSDGSKGVLIECKYADNGDFDFASEEAFTQMDKNHYDGFFLKGTDITYLAATFFQKRCLFFENEK